MSALPLVIVINQNPSLGGGEVYTAFFCRALLDLGYPVTLFVHPQATFCNQLEIQAQQGFSVIRLENEAALLQALPTGRAWVVTHARISAETARAIRQTHLLTGFCHMPLFDRKPDVLMQYDWVFAVSQYVLGTMRSHGMDNVYAEPLYGVATLDRHASNEKAPIVRRAIIAPDRRIIRDRFFSWFERLKLRCVPQPRFAKRPGLTFALVSAIGPIKQFDHLFAVLAPILARHATVHLDIFGQGSVHSVRKLRKALAPLGERARFWGFQNDIPTLYAHVDYLLTGLPEKEALGLNVLEAQASGVPVLAVNAAPFTETVIDGVTGYLYQDPRKDQGASFAVLLEQLIAQAKPIDPRAAPEHLARFSQAAFNERVRGLAEFALAQL